MTAAKPDPDAAADAGPGPDAVAELHRRAMEASARTRHATARRLLLTALRRNPGPAQRAHLLLSLAYQESELRGLAEGLALLDEADAIPGVPHRIGGLIASQRALLHLRAGRNTDAITWFGVALHLLDDSVPQDVCRALLNRGLLHLRLRELPHARADFGRCAALASRHGLDVLAAKAGHNLGYLALLAGDLPRALREMDAVAPALSAYSAPMAAVCLLDHAQALLAAGLFREGDEDLSRAAVMFRRAGIGQEHAETELARARIALMEDRWADARRLAGQAGRRFAARGARTWALLAEQAAVEAAVGRRRRLSTVAHDASRLSAELATAGLADESRGAALTAAAAHLARGDHEAARAAAGPAMALRRDDPLTTRLQCRSVRAGLADAEGRPGRADTELRAALRDLHRYQASFGSMDLQTAVSAHGRQLAAQGLSRALADGGPGAVFGWAERARALSSRLRPVVPPADPEAAALLEELRHLHVQLRERRLSGARPDPGLQGRYAAVQRRVRGRSWYVPGPGQTESPVSLARLRERLAAPEVTFVGHLISQGRLHALVVGSHRPVVRALGPATPVLELGRRLRADLDALASHHLPKPLWDAVLASRRSALRDLDRLLWHPVRDLLGGGPLLLAPSAALAALPWTLLPTLHRRPATVIGSATAWLDASARAAARTTAPVVALAAGPRVPRAEEEIRLIADQWHGSGAMSAAITTATTIATTTAVRDAAVESDILHIAAHGSHEPHNPLFSHLDLADGPLFGHELNQLSRLPSHIVLSACELGLSGARPGDETVGMAAALLHAGAGSVVAGVARVSDSAACLAGPAHHAGLRRGLSPAEALAGALAACTDAHEEAPPFVCFGAGW